MFLIGFFCATLKKYISNGEGEMNHTIRLINSALEKGDFSHAASLLNRTNTSIDDVKVASKEGAHFLIDYIKNNDPAFSINKTSLIKTLSKYVHKEVIKNLFSLSTDTFKPDINSRLKAMDCYLDNKELKSYNKDHQCLKKLLGDADSVAGFGNAISILKAHTKCEPGVDCHKIKEYFTVLYNANPIVAKVMEVGAKACKIDKCHIVFTHDKHFTGKFEDKEDVVTAGYFDGRSDLFMAADKDELDLYGTFIHEVTHYAMKSLYKNSANPYPEKNPGKIKVFFSKKHKIESNKKDFDDVANRVEQLAKVVKPQNTEQDNIKYMLNHLKEWYEEKDFNTELVVRYPHLIASSYHDEDVERYLKPLVDYYNSHLMPDMNDYVAV